MLLNLCREKEDDVMNEGDIINLYKEITGLKQFQSTQLNRAFKPLLKHNLIKIREVRPSKFVSLTTHGESFCQAYQQLIESNG